MMLEFLSKCKHGILSRGPTIGSRRENKDITSPYLHSKDVSEGKRFTHSSFDFICNPAIMSWKFTPHILFWNQLCFFLVVCILQAIRRIKWMPLLVLAARLCPAGIEGTFFALLMSVDNVGMLSASWAGGLLLQATGIRRKNFKYLWLTVLIRNIMVLFPLPFLGLIPNTDPDLPILPPELLGASIEPIPVAGSEHTTIDEEKDEEDVHLPMFASDRGHQS